MQCSVDALWKTTGRCLHKQCNAAGGCLLLVTKDLHGFGEVLHTTAVPLHLGLGRKKIRRPGKRPRGSLPEAAFDRLHYMASMVRCRDTRGSARS